MTTELTLRAIGTSISHISTHESLLDDSAIASRLPHKFSASTLITTKSTSIRNITRLYISIFISKSPTPSKSNMTPLTSIENIYVLLIYSLPTYHSVSPLSSTYTLQSYLTIDDLYMRYAPLKHVRSTHQPTR